MASLKYIYSKPWPPSKYIYSKPWPPSNIYIPNHGLLQIYIFQTMAYLKYIYSKPWPT